MKYEGTSKRQGHGTSDNERSSAKRHARYSEDEKDEMIILRCASTRPMFAVVRVILHLLEVPLCWIRVLPLQY